ncbi:MAG: DUF2892 domain-containing protein [Thermodesulfobacteriota bacterium]|nr:DUF2892 domain-containing protein [Thermodesulfobacteriota bacterium]
MEVNEGLIDRLVRLALAIIILVLFLTGNLPGYWSLLLIFTGTFAMTAITGYCPLYKPLGINTGKK